MVWRDSLIGKSTAGQVDFCKGQRCTTGQNERTLVVKSEKESHHDTKYTDGATKDVTKAATCFASIVVRGC